MSENIRRLSTGLISKIRKCCHAHRMFEPGDTVAAAVSGGPDSVAMLHGLLEMKDELGISISVAHLDHGFREESAAEARFVGRMAESLGLPFYTEKARLKERFEGLSVNRQAKAREARYEFLERAAIALKAGKIAIAHTADDQAETVLMRLIRGSGTQGIAAIPPIRERIVRPLIYATRSEVEDYLAGKNIESVSDPSNLKKVYLRNHIRLELMPALRAYNPRITEALSKMAELLRADEEFLETCAGESFESIAARHSPEYIALDLGGFEKLPEAIKRRVLRLAVEEIKGDTFGLSYEHVLNAVNEISEGHTGRGIDIPGGLRVEKNYRKILVHIPHEEPPFSCSLPTPEAGVSSSAEIPGLGLKIEAEALPETAAWAQIIASDDKNTALFDAGRLAGPLTIRNRRPGDFFYPAGMEGRKKLKEYFMDLKLPRALRSRVPLLECGGEIAWVVGYRRDGRFMPGPETKKFIRVKTWIPDKIIRE